MGHGKKNANRGDAINRNAARAETNRKSIGELRKSIRNVRTDASIARLALERRVLGEIQNVIGELHELLDEFDLHRRPLYRKVYDWTRLVLRLEATQETDPDIDIDFSSELDPLSSAEEEEEMDHGKPLDPEKLLASLERGIERERGVAADIMENQELDEEERIELMDRAMERIETMETRINHQKLVVAGFVKGPQGPAEEESVE